MKKLILFITLLFVGISANAQYTPYNQLNYVKLLKIPPTGSVNDSVVMFDGSDSFLKMLPVSALPVIHTTGNETKAGVLTLNDGLKINPTALNIPSTVNHLVAIEIDGTISKIDPVNLPWNCVTPEQFGAVGDGVTDDSVAFSNALLASNFVCTLKDKIYLIGNVDVTGKKVYGNGTIRKKASSESAFHIKGDGTVIDGLTFNAQKITTNPNLDIKLGEGSKNITIKNCVFTSATYGAIGGSPDTISAGGTPYVTPVDGVLITNCIFKKLDVEPFGYYQPLYLHSINNITITNNLFRDTARDAIRLRENDGNCLINGNTFINIGDPTWSNLESRDAVDTYWSGNTLTISNNIISTTAYSAFDIKGTNTAHTEASRKVIITGNQIKKTRFSGIHLGGINDNLIDDYIDNYIISNNIITKCNQDNSSSGHGIHVDGVVRYLDISHNQITENLGRGIFIVNSYATANIIKGVSIIGNQCLNNGRSGVTGATEAGISVSAVDGLIISDNICSNDSSLPNPYQAGGIYVNSTSGTFLPSKSAIIKGNICRNNITNQILIDANNSRADNIAVFADNIQVGTGAIHRGTWQDQRSSFWGNGIPATGDGIFRRGDIIRNISPSIIGSAGNRYTVTGWERVSATGNTHVLNTDWVEMRTLTDNTEFATLASPAFTGNPTAPTATAGDNDTSIATTAFVTGAIATADALIVKLAGSQTLTGSKTFTAQTFISGSSPNSAGLLNIQGNGMHPSLLVSSGGSGTNALFNAASANSIVSNIATGGTGLVFVGQDAGTNTFTINKAGGVTANTVTLNSVLKLKAYTVSTLPAGTVGDMAYVTDATAPTYNGTLIGGGAVKIPVFYDGTTWKAH